MHGILSLRGLQLFPAYKKIFEKSMHTCCSNPAIFGTPPQEGFLKRVAQKLGLNKTPKSVLRASGYLMYIKIADEIDYKNFFKYCDLEDTFVSWFSVMELHIWMVAARLMEEGEEGRTVRNSMIKAMWEDGDMRTKKLEGALPSARKKQILELNDQFQASLISYDEGLLGNDKILAGALWRRFLQDKKPKDDDELLKQIIAVEMLVLYVRSQFYTLQSLSREQLLIRRAFQWAPFNESLFEMAENFRETKKT